jgi:RNA 2',3'-cyclic 3'-phosphodiesterase
VSADPLRLFIAVDLPDDVRAALAAWGTRAAGGDRALRTMAPGTLHVTLAFLGERPVWELDGLRAVLRGAAGKAPAAVPLALDGALWLSPRRPHVLTVRIADPSGALGRLHRRLIGELGRELGWEGEERPLRPHVTVARVRQGRQPARTGLPDAPAAAFHAPSLTLYRSVLGPAAAVHEPLERIALPAG